MNDREGSTPAAEDEAPCEVSESEVPGDGTGRGESSPLVEAVTEPAVGSGRRGWLWLGLAVGVLSAAGAALLLRSPSLPEGLSQEEFNAAAEKFESLYKKKPDRLDVLSLAAELAVVEGRREDAVACFAEIPSGHPRYGLSARLQEGHVLLELNRAREAESSLRAYLAMAARVPDVPPLDVYAARSRLAFILSVELRIEERQSLLVAAHESGTVDLFNSKQFYFPHLLIWHSKSGSDRLQEFLKVDPDNRRLRLAHARYLTYQGKPDEALAILKKLLTEDASDSEAAAAVLEAHYESDDWESFGVFLKSVQEYRVGEPWLLTRMRGHFAMEQEDWELAVTRFEQVLSADRTNPSAQSAIARAFRELKQTENAEAAQRRSATIAKIRVGLAREEALEELAENCEEIGMPDAADTFRRHADMLKREALKSFQTGLPGKKPEQ